VEPVSDNQEPFKRISAAEAKQMIEQGVTVVDVRTPAEWNGGHIPQAQHVPLDSILARPRDVLKGDNLIFVCQVGQRSALAAEMAAAVGFKTLYNLEGGTDAWVRAGYPVST
jgi:rhodanese-related sulfurtransferase